MALGESYATLSELKARLRISDTTDDTRLTEALSAASRGIEHCTDRQFNSAGVTATTRLYYPDMPHLAYVDDFSTTTDLVIEIDTADDGTYATEWTAAEYQLEPLNGIEDGQSGWPYYKIRAVGTQGFPCNSRASIRVTARWGWAAVPAGVKEATLILAEDVFKLADAPFGVGGYGEYGRIKARENPHVWTRIAAYRRNAVLVG